MPKKSQARSRTKTTKKTGTSKRGFAAMSPEKRRKIAAMGGRHSHDGDRKRREGFLNEEEDLDKSA